MASGTAQASHAVAVVNLSQQNADMSALCNGCTTSSNMVLLGGDSDGATCANNNYWIDVEVQPVGQPFTGQLSYSGKAQQMMKPNCVQTPYPFIIVGPLAAGQYHWQIRESLDSPSIGPWTAFNGDQLAFVIVNPSAVSVSPGSLAFGDQQINSASSAQSVTLTSVGKSTLTITALGASPPYSLTSAKLPIVLAPNASTVVSVTFTPTKVGAIPGTLQIVSSAPSSPDNVALSGTGTVPKLVLAPTSFDFGNAAANVTTPGRNVTINNTGTAPLTIKSTTINGPFAIVGFPNLPATVAPGASLTFQVTFTPVGVGTVSGSLTIASNDPASPTTMALKGTGVSAGLNAVPNPIAYGNVQMGGGGQSLSLVLQSNVNQPVTVQSIALMPQGPEWQIDSLPMLPLTVAPLGMVALSITFKPQQHGARAATLVVVSDAPNSPLMANLGGSGIGPQIAALPNPLDFNAVNVGQTGFGLVTLQNSGETALTVMAKTFSGANGAEFASPSPLPIVVMPASTAQLAVQFAPSAMGARSGKVTLVSNDPLVPAYDIALMGQGTAAAISVMPPSVSFGSVNVGLQSAPVPVAIANTGAGALTVSGIMLGGVDAASFQFSAPSLPMVIPPGGSRVISPVFAPLALGVANAKISLVTDDGKAMNVDIPLSGTGLAAMIALDSTTIDFGSQIVGHASPTHMISVSNKGTAALTLFSLSIAGAQGSAFSLLNAPMLPATVAPGATQAVAMVHLPGGVGTDTGKLSIASSDPTSPLSVATLTGLGVSTVIGVSPTTLDFGSIHAPGMSMAMAVTITNTGGDPENFVDATVSGPGASVFVVDSAAGMLAPGAKKMVNVKFTPMATGVFKATVMFKTDDKTIPAASVQVMGNGAAAKVAAAPGSLDFGKVTVNLTSPAKTLTLMNVTSSPVKIMSITSDMPVFTIGNADSLTIAPGGRSIFTVAFAPVAEGAASAKISVTLVGGGGPEVIVAAMGSGVLAMGNGDAGMGGMTTPGGCTIARRGARGKTGAGAEMLAAGMILIVLAARRRRIG